MFIFVLAPILCFFFLFLSFHKKRLARKSPSAMTCPPASLCKAKRGGSIENYIISYTVENLFCWRTSFLLAAVTCGILVLISTEILSLLHLINFKYILIFWILSTAAAIYIFLAIPELKKPAFSFNALNLSRTKIILLFSIFIIIAGIGITAFVAPPNNWDSLTTHMSRVAHWIQNQTVANYPTSMLKQLNYPPWAAYAIMHLRILSGSDIFANLIQWFCMLGSIIGVSLIARQLGANSRTQIISSVIAATIPMGILQASSTQNDYAAGFWLICFVYFFLLLKLNDKWTYILAIGASLGLAFMIKGTSYIYSVPFLIWLILAGYKKYRWKFAKYLATIITVILIINSCFYTRNLQLTGTLIPPSETNNMTNKNPDSQKLFSSIIRNIGLHFCSPFPKADRAVEKCVSQLHALIGIKTEGSEEYKFHFSGLPFHEDHAGNFLHFMLIFICIIIFLLSKQHRKKRNVMAYLAAVSSGFILLMLYVKWTPFHSRYHLPVFLLYSPFIGITLSGTRARNTAAATVCTILILCSFPWVFQNHSRPLFRTRNIFNTKRINQYFTNRPYLLNPYFQTVNYLKRSGCSDIGISLGGDDWEYPFWILMKKDTDQKIRIEHVIVKNDSSLKNVPYPSGSFIADGIIHLHPEKKLNMIIGEDSYVKTGQFTHIGVFIRDDDGSLTKRNLTYHFSKTFEYSQKIAIFLRELTTKGNVDKKDFVKMIQLMAKELTSARIVNTDELNIIYDGLGDHFKNIFLMGLEQRMAGYANTNQELIISGEKLLTKWRLWLNENKKEIEKAFKNYKE